ncbi:SDR family NAD(P)-dependent oxidoreductase [Aestuariivirga sp. YIM B02566]|uniref:SDR family NAD(P)-dependent oxidoreductase n=1 Tax=Taklimakanibacter albus TaxID=2800327 RepID=A0ACC5R713_9HYPH|nr:SDR family NAD(P)-dependent oxidoreductase [Aestuariivirga sp. YIM B02566]MBK1868444.1 SDR family NAD(P)-dependent oxidoreductase [Aestuariivirga sp. YIM B02566]
MTEESVTIITGAGKGLGKAVAKDLIDRGGHVVLVVRSEASASMLAKEFGAKAVIVTKDVTAPDAAEAALAAGVARWGKVDGLVNNAGVVDPIARIADSDPAQWEAAIAINLVAPYRFTRAFLAQGDRSAKRRIVNISSGAAHQPLEGWNAYCASKAGLAMLTRATGLEYAQENVFAFGLLPGVFDTGMQATIRASGINEVSRLPRTALRPPEEPARATAYLLSGAADDLAGGEVNIRDAGFRERVGLPGL